MLQPHLISNLAVIRYQEMLQTAEAARRFRAMQEPTPQLVRRAGALLITLGQKLGGQGQPAPRRPALRLK